jgi:hypothetical protein
MYYPVPTAVNEPWSNTPLEILKDFYWSSYQIIQASAPQWVTLFHDSFRLNLDNWGNGFMKNCKYKLCVRTLSIDTFPSSPPTTQLFPNPTHM